MAAWLRPCRTSPKEAAPPKGRRRRASRGPVTPSWPAPGPTAPRGHRPAAGNAGNCDSLHKAAAAAAAAALSDVPAELHAGGPLTGRRRCSASSIDRERGESYREGKRARPAPPPPSGGLSRDGGLCEASALANWIRFPVLPRRRVCGGAFGVLFRAPVRGATSHSPHTPSSDGSVRVN